MQSKGSEKLIEGAVTSLAKVASKPDISDFEAALILASLPLKPRWLKLREQLTARLRLLLDAKYIETGPLEEVFAVIRALHAHNASAITGEHLACMVQRLVAEETAPGGPYGRNEPEDNSLSANLLIWLCMKQLDVDLPRVRGLLQKQTEAARTPLKLAIFLQVATVTNVARNAALETLAATRQDTGYWIADEVSEAGFSPVLVTAVVVAALRDRPQPDSTHIISSSQKMVVCQAAAAFAGQGLDVSDKAAALLERIASADKTAEITLLPAFFARALKHSPSLADRVVTSLGVANLQGWLAYTVYDDFLDGEGKAFYLPIANMAMRRAMFELERSVADNSFRNYMLTTYDLMDRANAWEILHCRASIRDGNITVTSLPRFGERTVLADRALGHLLGPVAVAILAGTSIKNPSIRFIEQAFRHYLIARQLNDDAHDWYEDWQQGRITYVVAAILQDLCLPPGVYKIERLAADMRTCFARTTLPKIFETVLTHAKQSRQCFARSGLITDSNEVTALLDRIESIARLSLQRQREGRDFVRAYKDLKDD